MGMFVMSFGGISYSWSIIQPFIMSHYAIDAAAASVPFSMNLGIFVVGCIIGGRLQTRYSIRKALRFGIIISFSGLFFTGLVPARMPWLLTVTFGAFTGIGGGIVYNTLIAAMQKYFPDKKGMAGGAILCMIGLSGFYMSPFINFLLNNYSLRVMFLLVAILTLAVGLVGSIYVKEPPYGYMANYQTANNKALSSAKQYEPKEMLKTKYYYIITISMFLAVPGFMLISPQFVLISSQRMITSTQALSAVMLASIFQAVGRLVVPSLSDKVGRKITLICVFGFSTACITGLVMAKGMLYPVLFVALAFFYGGTLGTFPALSTDYFGIKNAGINYGFIMIGFGLASLLCPVLIKAVQGTSLGVALSFVIAGVACVLGLILLSRLKSPDHEQAGRLDQ
jgi:OFA family oxalate/formate antiporter-like MFS transporter